MVLLALVLACSGPDPVDGPGPTSGTDTSDTDTSGDTGTVDSDPGTPFSAARAALQADGFVVGDGALVFSTMEGCCDPLANCWGNNPSTPYGAYALPPAPGQPPRPDTLLDAFGPVPEGLSRDFLLRPDEAIVWLGTMPPRARYFGFRSLIGQRPGVGYAILGSLGAATNQMTVEAQRGEPAWEQPLAVLTTADPGVEQRVIDALVAGGWDREHIALDRMAPVVNLGLDPQVHDSLFTTLRVAVYDDPVAGAAWEQDPGSVWRLTLDTPPAPQTHGMPDLPQRGSGQDESAWAEARDALEVAILERFQPVGASQLERIEPYWRETLECIDDGFGCAGDIRDRFVGITPTFRLPRSEDVVVAFGVNHEATGRSSYSSVSVQTINKQRGIASFTSANMAGSARPFLDHPLVDDLYVVLYARDCTLWPDTTCIEVPWECPGGPGNEALKLTGRAYLDPATGAAPAEEELLPDKALLLFPGLSQTTDTGTTDTSTTTTTGTTDTSTTTTTGTTDTSSTGSTP